jgi:hypothetical protein
MKYYSESELNLLVDESTKKLFDTWHELCNKRLQADIPLLAANRKEDRRFKNFDSPYSTATPQKVGNDLYLVLWLESIEPLDSLLVSHELGHFILNLRGFKCLIDSYSPSSEIGGVLNSFAHHPPLFSFQRSFGQEPQVMIDTKVLNDVLVYEGDTILSEKYHIRDGLIFADDLNNCSVNFRDRLIKSVITRYPKIYNTANMVLNTLKYYDLNNPKENFKFLKNLKKVLKLGNSWIEFDYAGALGKSIRRS